MFLARRYDRKKTTERSKKDAMCQATVWRELRKPENAEIVVTARVITLRAMMNARSLAGIGDSRFVDSLCIG
ncbi:MAG TPA: hypothetical protein VN678_02775 [Acidobacteriaceae bacterium]|nr:hypothetical protein [Acidobacteriaceae bacterium]